MSKANLYSKLKGSWRQWDEDVYRLASSMVAAFRGVIDNAEAEPSLVAEMKQLSAEVEQYELWHSTNRKAG